MYVLTGAFALMAVVVAWFTLAAWLALRCDEQPRTITQAIAIVGPLVTIWCVYSAGSSAGLWL